LAGSSQPGFIRIRVLNRKRDGCGSAVKCGSNETKSAVCESSQTPPRFACLLSSTAGVTRLAWSVFFSEPVPPPHAARNAAEAAAPPAMVSPLRRLTRPPSAFVQYLLTRTLPF
jgi:hypothetical protein